MFVKALTKVSSRNVLRASGVLRTAQVQTPRVNMSIKTRSAIMNKPMDQSGYQD